MPRIKKGLSKTNQWTLILLGGLGFIYLGFHWQDLLHPKVAHDAAVAGSVSEIVSPVRLDINDLGINAPVIYSASSKPSDVESELQSGVVHLAGSAVLGEVGNAYIVGHSSNYKSSKGNYNEIFKRLPEIQVGDSITITQGKKILKFTVYETRVVESTELWVMSQETSGARNLSLQTSYPVGTADKRFVAVARLQP